ncbi:hypothetical protein SAMN05444008_11239 [Cnuella takakiae]|uniref:Uncharacterized protein n=1 Tax=Cnuella takakiae TaxID=1302690 RepID=A0A1M5EGT0_9BACT|nr:hypothetical protein [Cnuella takakiae]OLY91172.1 hypothetical protein BUE76_04105 [Cnuella takakiae]SHF78397.1 hypothetical protein SAMN05444008_11239 [Cnuella takakiae]
MQHEKSDKPSALHSKLQGLEQLPGEPAPDTAALWSRLERRMEHRPAPQRRYLLWAAACLLLVAGAAAFFTYQQEEQRQAQQPTVGATHPVAISSDPVKAAAPVVDQQAIVLERKVTGKPNRNGLVALPKVQQHEPVKAAPVAATGPSTPEMQAPIATPPATPDIALVEQPPARKLKVVHLNEIGKVAPVPPGNALLAHETLPAHRDGRGSISFSRNTSDDIIKINLSPVN